LSLVFYPPIAALTILVSALVLVDVKIRAAQRWQERWLDYRVIAERLRCVRFLHPLGLSLDQISVPLRHGQEQESWVAWYVRRCEQALDPPDSAIGDAELAQVARRLADVEIPEQLAYHRAAFRQLALLDRRLSFAATFALWTSFGVVALFLAAAFMAGGYNKVAWRPIAIILAFVLPAVATTFSAIRVHADLVLLVERSAITAAALRRLHGLIRSTAVSYDRVAVAATRLAEIMSRELSEWRFVLENRRVRAQRTRALGRLWRRLGRGRKAGS
jgi:hypothetical protein